MVAQILADARQFVNHRDAQLPQVVGRANPRQHQDLRRGHGAGAEHNLPGLDGEYFATAFHLHTHGGFALKQDAPDNDVGPHRQVEAMPHRPEEGERSAHPHPFRVVHGDGPHTARFGVIHIRIRRVAGIQARLHEGLLEGQPLLAGKTPHRNRAFGAVEVVADVQIGFHLAEVGQDIYVLPAGVALGGPAVVVFGHAAEQHLPVDGAGAAHDLAAGRRQQLRLLRRALRPPRPVVRRALRGGVGLVTILQIVGVKLVFRIVRPGFQQQHRAALILGQPGCDHAPAGTRANHDNIVLHSHTCPVNEMK